jgi:hypothetical protein
MAVTLPPTRLQRAEHYCVQYAVVLPGGVTLDQAMEPDYWAHVGKNLRQHDTIRLIPEDGSFFAEALVLTSGPGFAKLKMLRQLSLEEDGEPVAATLDFFTKYNGPHDKHVVIRRSDGEKLKTGFATKPEAQRWLDEHAAAVNR